ncbi:MAG TPA: ABC-three component system protein [Cyclobacteriaceae bacterium]|jgi:hypothetical protein|nr:ABC-three component system protein [Cyclobacteriaceae bacterium]
MAEEIVRVDNSSVEGDVAGGNIDKSKHFHFEGPKTSYMKMLLEKFKLEQNSNASLMEYIEDLDYYYNKKKDDVVGLDQKLKEANRDSFVSFAIEAKDKYHRKLYRYQFSEAAQKINLHLLGLVISYFENEIKPMILKGEDEQVINSMINERLVKPLLNELDENLLGYSAHDINGMLYFLTGNCHIKWVN